MMMYLCPGGACIDGRWYRWNGVTNKGSGDIYEGDVVFRSGLKDGIGDWKFYTIFTRFGQISCNNFEIPRKRWALG